MLLAVDRYLAMILKCTRFRPSVFCVSFFCFLFIDSYFLLNVADIPAAVSLPHFYKADRKLLDAVDGLEPNETLHSTSLAIQPVSRP